MKVNRLDVRQLSVNQLIKAIQEPDGAVDSGDCLIELQIRYLPLIKSVAAGYYSRVMDFDDWKQEASLVMLKIIHTFDTKRRINFGSFYKRCLKNHFRDVIRKQTAKKRIPNRCLTSYSANQEYYDDVLQDYAAPRPDRSIMMNDRLKRLIHRFSDFERMVITKSVFKHQSFNIIAKVNRCSVSKVQNAMERCRLKYRKMRDSGLN